VVWAIVYTLFLSFGLSIGSQVWDAFGPEQPGPDGAGSDSSTEVSVSGTFFGNNTVWNSAMSNGMSEIPNLSRFRAADTTGTFTFTNGSSTSTMTSVACWRNPEFDKWWYNEGKSTGVEQV
jgi:hypothetical protein